MSRAVLLAAAALSFLDSSALLPPVPALDPDCPCGAAAGVYGLVVGDPDADRDDDLVIGFHMQPPALLENQPAGFVDRASLLEHIEACDAADPTPWESFGDKHVGAFGDADGDGLSDLALITGARFGSGAGFDQLYRVESPWTSAWADEAGPLTIQDGAGSGRYGLWLDLYGDGDLDLFVGHAGCPPGPTLVCGEPEPACDPASHLNKLWNNAGGLASPWSDAAPSAGIASADNTGAGLATDINLDGYVDLLLTGVYARPGRETPQDLHVYLGSHTGIGANPRATDAFLPPLDCPGTANVASLAVGDLDNDGWPDLVLGRIGGERALVLRNDRSGAGPCLWPGRKVLGKESKDATATVLADLDNDGDLDLFLGREGTRQDGVWTNKGNGVLKLALTLDRWPGSDKVQATWLDHDRDGWLDLVVGAEATGAPGAPGPSALALWTNESDSGEGAANRFVVVRPEAHPVFGASVSVEPAAATTPPGQPDATLTRWIHSGGGFHAYDPQYAHFGVGRTEWVDITVAWPDGSVTTAVTQPSNACYAATRDAITSYSCP